MGCKLIKIEIRNNLIYPVMFTITLNILNIIRILIKELIKLNLIIIYPLLLFVSTVFISLILLYRQTRKKKPKKSKKKNSFMDLTLIQTKKEMNRVDNEYKIIILYILDAYFDFIGSLRRYYLNQSLKYEDPSSKGLKNVEMRIRSREIFFAAILCYFTIKIKFYKHQIISLIFIFVFLIICLVLESINMKYYKYDNTIVIIYLILQIIISLCRVYSDIIEKYLFEFNYVNHFKILIFKNTLEIIFSSLLFFSNQIKSEIEEFKKLSRTQFWISISLLILFFIASGFKNIYKILTIDTYSPMVRTICDCFFDVIFYSISEIKDKETLKVLFFIDLICKIFILFFNLVYNEFLVLYCFGMEKNTHKGIVNRAFSSLELMNNIEQDRNSLIDNDSIQ